MLCTFECPKQTTILIPFTAELQTILKQYWERVYSLEGDKFDLERNQKLKQFEVKTLSLCTDWFLILFMTFKIIIIYLVYFSFARVSFVGCEIIIHITHNSSDSDQIFEAENFHCISFENDFLYERYAIKLVAENCSLSTDPDISHIPVHQLYLQESYFL
jgi:hypothetical protein